MGEVNMKGVILTPLKKIHHPKGNILHAQKDDKTNCFELIASLLGFKK